MVFWRTSSDVEEKYGEALDLNIPQYQIDSCTSEGQKSMQKERATYKCINKLVKWKKNLQREGEQTEEQKKGWKQRRSERKQEKEKKRRLKEKQAIFSQYEKERDGRIHTVKQKSPFSLRRNNDKRKNKI